jgi:hypothetical protein
VSNNARQPGRNIRVRVVRRNPPDVRKLSRALLAIVMAEAQAEADARAEHQASSKREGRSRAA